MVDQTEGKKASFLDGLFHFDSYIFCCFPFPALLTDFENSRTRKLYWTSQSYIIECDRKHFNIGLKWIRILGRMDIQKNLFKTSRSGRERQELGKTIEISQTELIKKNFLKLRIPEMK